MGKSDAWHKWGFLFKCLDVKDNIFQQETATKKPSSLAQ